jgi:hypothetical protein
MSVPIGNAETVMRSQMRPGWKRCYQRGLESDPNQSGKLAAASNAAPGGEVHSVRVVRNTGLSTPVATCVTKLLEGSKFDPPGPSGSTIEVEATFSKQ